MLPVTRHPQRGTAAVRAYSEAEAAGGGVQQGPYFRTIVVRGSRGRSVARPGASWVSLACPAWEGWGACPVWGVYMVVFTAWEGQWGVAHQGLMWRRRRQPQRGC